MSDTYVRHVCQTPHELLIFVQLQGSGIILIDLVFNLSIHFLTIKFKICLKINLIAGDMAVVLVTVTVYHTVISHNIILQGSVILVLIYMYYFTLFLIIDESGLVQKLRNVTMDTTNYFTYKSWHIKTLVLSLLSFLNVNFEDIYILYTWCHVFT